ncbi:AraC family transcriptional regulator [Sphingomonas sp. BK235]|uniref:AraC family transcriptional regulator n=1 Tax=Sphingomonas sp. BK235 TaxID=2512131 RepID=UPI00104ACE2F|nr:AraC family transcriptional regulator [Sphingomonas sp. BK235]TCP36067.1 AraC family transcriptional regulator [Sphingomonas sp. BK235]
MIVQEAAEDPLSDVLAAMQLRVATSASLRAGNSWSIRFQVDRPKFNVVRHGGCWLVIPDEPPCRLAAGDCLVASRGTFVLTSDPDLVPIDAEAVFTRNPRIADVGGAIEVELLGGSVSFDETQADLMSNVLPPILLIAGGVPAADRMAWLLELLSVEWGSGLPGARAACDDIMRLLFVQTLRRCLGGETIELLPTPSWLSGLADASIAKAMTAIHAEPARHWRLQQLAAVAGQSRSTFAERFVRKVGVPPVEYATRWRMQLAARRLRSSTDSVTRVAESLGYLSDSSFSSAFTRAIGSPPGSYRRGQDAERRGRKGQDQISRSR